MSEEMDLINGLDQIPLEYKRPSRSGGVPRCYYCNRFTTADSGGVTCVPPGDQWIDGKPYPNDPIIMCRFCREAIND